MRGRLNARDLDFLACLRAGESARAYAIRNHYHTQWAKYESKKVRRLLGVATIEEAVDMSEVTVEDIRALRKEIADLKEAQQRLADAKTPAAKESAREDVREAKADLDAELRQRGLSRADLDELQESKEYDKFKARQSRYEQEREAERQAAELEANGAKEPAARKPKVEKVKAEPETPPQSQHWADRPLWGRKEGE